MIKIANSYLYNEICENEKNNLFYLKDRNPLTFNIIKEKEMKNISSFRDINSYTIFVNFRKIRFMIDGSLTFNFLKGKI